MHICVFIPMRLHVFTRLYGHTLMYVHLYKHTSKTVPYMCVGSVYTSGYKTFTRVKLIILKTPCD